MLGQAPRLSYTMSYKGIVVGGMNDYHPEKIDISLTKTIDYIEGESREDIEKRLEATKELEELLAKDIQRTVSEKVKRLKAKIR